MKITMFLRYIMLGLFVTTTSACFAQTCLSGWQYYMPITVTNNVSTTLSNYDVKVIVDTKSLFNSAHMLSSSGDDIRFVDPSNCSDLSYWIESGINTGTTTIWVKIPTLSASSNKTIDMYYGNGSAAAASNGDSTFLIFDDFIGSSLNTTKWKTYSSNTSFTVSGGKLTVAAGSSPSNDGNGAIVSVASFTPPITVEGLLTATNGFWSTFGMLNTGTMYGYAMYFGDYTGGQQAGLHLDQLYANCATYTGDHVSDITSPGTVTGLWQMSWPSTGSQLCSWPGGSTSASLSGLSLGSSVQVTAGNLCNSIGYSTFDWLRARPYASSEPSTSNGSEVSNYYLEVSPISGSPFCTSTADSFYISFSTGISATFNSNNVFTAQLSDSSGSFASPTDIGTLTSTNAGNILVKIPAGTYGLHFRIRVTNSTNSTYNSGPSSSVLAFVPNAKPGFSINSIYQCLKGNDFVFNNSSTGSGTLAYRWSFGDGSTNNTTSPIYSYSNNGSYTVTLMATNSVGCSDSVSKTVKVYSAASLFSVNNPTQCYTGNSFSFTNKSFGYNSLAYKWDFGDGNTSTSANPTYSYSSAGVYTVNLYVTADSTCTDTSHTTITVNPRVYAGFSVSNSDACLNQQNFVFTNSSSVASGSLGYRWDFGDGNSSTNPSPGYKYKSAGTYQVKLLATAGSGCFDTISKFISVYSLPTATTKAGTTTICDGGQVPMQANIVSGYKYQWLDNGSKIFTSGTSSSYDAITAGSYKVVTTNTDGCTDTSSPIIVTVNPLPPAPVISQVKSQLKSNANEAAYQWYLNGVLIPGADSMNYSPTVQSGSFTVTVTDTNGCSNSSSAFDYSVSGIEMPGFDNQIGIYPNPAHESINIDLSSSKADIQYLQMIDMNGRSIKTIEHLAAGSIVKVSTGDMAKGMYFIKFTGKDNTFIQKVVVE